MKIKLKNSAILVSLIILSGCAAVTAVLNNNNAPLVVVTGTGQADFGIYTAWSQGKLVSSQVKIKAAQALQVTYVRIPAESLAQEYSGTVSAGFKVNMGVTKASLAQDLNLYKADIVSVENEENNPQQYSGTIDDYRAELTDAVIRVHAAGMQVTNGGLTQIPAFLCAWADLYQRDKPGASAAARSFESAVPEVNISGILKYPAILKNATYLKGMALIGIYKSLPIDYVNFHYYAYSANGAAAMGVIIDYLRQATGKDVITNEFGQRDTSAATVTALMLVANAKKLKCAIWFNSDSLDGSAFGLMDLDGKLRNNGLAFGNLLRQKP